MPRIRWTKPFVFLLCLLPALLLAWDWHKDALGPNPAENIIHTNGNWTIHFLLITLCISPLRKLLRVPSLIQFRRMLGLSRFFYGALPWWRTCGSINRSIGRRSGRTSINGGSSRWGLRRGC